jgi:hypothetical protein
MRGPGAAPEGRYGSRRAAQFGLDESLGRREAQFARRLAAAGGTLPFEHKGLSSVLGYPLADRLRMLIERARKAITRSVLSPDKNSRRRAARWSAWSAFLIVPVAGYIAVNSQRAGTGAILNVQEPQGHTAVDLEPATPVQDWSRAEIPPLGTIPEQAPATEGKNPSPEVVTPQQARSGRASLAQPAPVTKLAPPLRMVRTANQQAGGPIVYVHTSRPGDVPLIEDIGVALRREGYRVRDTRLSRNGTQGDVRFFFNRDRRDAEQLRSRLQAELGKRGYELSLQLLERDGRKFAHAAPGKIEVWLPPLSNSHRMG